MIHFARWEEGVGQFGRIARSLVAGLGAAAACAAAQPTQPKAATAVTRAAHARARQELAFPDKQDFEDARRGFIAALPEEIIRNAEGWAVFDLTRYYFIRDREEAPVTVNPSLWRQERLVVTAGLFKVRDGICQVGGYDLANMTFIEGDPRKFGELVALPDSFGLRFNIVAPPPARAQARRRARERRSGTQRVSPAARA